jgi:hypothetical protein
MSLFSKNKSNIKSAKLLGVRQAEETLLFHTSNFSLYSFFVEYADGTTAVIECTPTPPTGNKKKEKELFDKLIAISNQTSQSKSADTQTSGSILDELQKLKDLHDSGIIPDELFQKRSESLVEKMSNLVNAADPNSPNFYVERERPRSVMEGKSILIIDGEKTGHNLDAPVSLRLDFGSHTISIARGFVSSQKFKLNVCESKTYKLTFDPKTVSIDAELVEK